MEFMETNVGSRRLRELGKLLLYGSCIEVEWPEHLRALSEGRFAASVCLEREHYNMVAYKLACAARASNLSEVVALSVDGSPHCVQLHMLVEEVRKLIGGFEALHYVVYKGRLYRVEAEDVKLSRYLSKVARLARGPSLSSQRPP